MQSQGIRLSGDTRLYPEEKSPNGLPLSVRDHSPARQGEWSLTRMGGHALQLLLYGAYVVIFCRAWARVWLVNPVYLYELGGRHGACSEVAIAVAIKGG